jgi:hypothetical protein
MVSVVGFTDNSSQQVASFCDNNGPNSLDKATMIDVSGGVAPVFGSTNVGNFAYLDNSTGYQVWLNQCQYPEVINGCGGPGGNQYVAASYCISPGQLTAWSRYLWISDIYITQNSSQCPAGTGGSFAKQLCSTSGEHASLAWIAGYDSLGTEEVGAACFRVQQNNEISLNSSLHPVIWLANASLARVYLYQNWAGLHTTPTTGWGDCFTQNNDYWFSSGNRDQAPHDLDFTTNTSTC